MDALQTTPCRSCLAQTQTFLSDEIKTKRVFGKDFFDLFQKQNTGPAWYKQARPIFQWSMEYLIKVGDSCFLRDDECRHDTGLEISIARSGSIAIKFNYR